MKKIIYILSFLFFVLSVSFAATPMPSIGAMNLYGYGSLIDQAEFSDNDCGDDDVDRKRRHRRRRKIRPPHKGW